MVAAASRDSYAGASVSAVIGKAGVSRPTFYEYFEDRDDCFVACVIDVHERLLAEVRSKLAEARPEQATATAVAATVAFAAAHPAEARFLMKESLAGGPAALAARDDGIDEMAQLIEETLAGVPGEVIVPDVPTAAVLGATQRLLAARLRRGERVLTGMETDLLAWVESYGQPAARQRWRTLVRGPAPASSPFLPRSAWCAPQLLGPGRPRIPGEEVAENHRLRIMVATSEVVAEHGYPAATVSEITRLAGVDGRGFYRLYTDKEEAFSAVHELGSQSLMAVTARAFFAGSDWPQRIWEAFRAATQNVQENPTIARVGFVDSYAAGPRGIQRVEDSRIAFTMFLQEGYRQELAGAPPSRLAQEAIMAAIFEIVYRETRASVTPKTTQLLGAVVHLCLAPFIGGEATEAFIRGKLTSRTT
jgi:AcrR family transcriptional regulator